MRGTYIYKYMNSYSFRISIVYGLFIFSQLLMNTANRKRIVICDNYATEYCIKPILHVNMYLVSVHFYVKIVGVSLNILLIILLVSNVDFELPVFKHQYEFDYEC